MDNIIFRKYEGHMYGGITALCRYINYRINGPGYEWTVRYMDYAINRLWDK